MEQSSPIDRIKVWLDEQTPVMRGLAIVGGLVVASLVVVELICVIAGWTDALQMSNALFYASSAMFALSLVFYFGNRGGPPQPDDEEEEDDDETRTRHLPSMMKRRRRDVPFYSITFILAGIVLFLLSMAIWYVWPS